MVATASKKSLLAAVLILAIFLSVATPSNATGLTYRELVQKPSCPPCLCCQTAIPPPCCYCACYVTQSGNKVP